MSLAPAAIALKGLLIQAPVPRGPVILGPLDLQVEPAERLLIVGPSGGGKSTLLRAIAGLCLPSQGTIHLYGELASDVSGARLPPEARGIGMLFQGGALWPHMSAAKTLAFVLKGRGMDASKPRVAHLLEQVHLGGYEKRMPGTLSGGERQRLALARAMATEPRILLLDEPLGPLDAELRRDLLQTLASLHAAHGWTTLTVTHDPGEAASFATRVLRIQGGLLVSDTATSTALDSESCAHS